MKKRNRVVPYVIMVFGAALTAFATKYLYDPAGLVTGGVSGLSIVLRHISGEAFGFEIPLWLGSIILNVPIFLLAFFTDGIRNVLRSILVWGIMTVMLFVMPEKEIIPDNLLLTAIFGGVCYGVGTGMLLTTRSTSGGTDLLASSIHHFLRHVSIGRILQVLDGLVVITGTLVFGIERTLYAVLSVYIMGKVIDYVLGSGRSAKMALIISTRVEEISREILKNLDRGVTVLEGTGMYTGSRRPVIMCICSRKDLVEIKEIVLEYDPRAFFVVNDVNEAIGEGFLQEWE